jgi:hypothetical protein
MLAADIGRRDITEVQCPRWKVEDVVWGLAVLSSLKGLICIFRPYPGLTPGAALYRRCAAGSEVSSIR